MEAAKTCKLMKSKLISVECMLIEINSELIVDPWNLSMQNVHYQPSLKCAVVA